MPWQCRLVEPAGKRYEVIYFSEQDDNRRPCIIHSHRYEITQDQYNDPEKFEKFIVTEPLKCGNCGELFTVRESGGPISFGTKTIWNTEDGHLHIGDMYYSLHPEAGFPSLEYKRDWQDKRRSLFVATPGGIWGVDQPASNGQNGSGWTVTGTAPNITTRPSIAMREYHGWLTNGELSDDLEGRTYDPNKVIRY